MTTIWQLIVISGASKGFGRSCALSFASARKSAIHFVLTGRSEIDLDDTKQLLQNIDSNISEIQIDLFITDLSNLSTLESVSNTLFDVPFINNPNRNYEKVIFVNNAGSLGPLETIGTNLKLEDISNVINFNVTSSSFLSAQIVGRFSSKMLPPSIQTLVIVNVSSLAAVEPFESWVCSHLTYFCFY